MFDSIIKIVVSSLLIFNIINLNGIVFFINQTNEEVEIQAYYHCQNGETKSIKHTLTTKWPTRRIRTKYTVPWGDGFIHNHSAYYVDETSALYRIEITWRDGYKTINLDSYSCNYYITKDFEIIKEARCCVIL